MKLFHFAILALMLLLCGQIAWSQADRVQNRGIGVRSPSDADSRLAVVIGNGRYNTTELELTNPVNDAGDMSAKLEKLGFAVTSRQDLTKSEMEGLFSQLPDLLAKPRVFLFYYAGHGVQVDGENYLIPVDADIKSAQDIKDKAVNLKLLLAKLYGNSNRLNIVILDACRNNPFKLSQPATRDLGGGSGGNKPNKGLAGVDITPLTNTLIAYSTQTDSLASDGSGRNGLFTSALLSEMEKPGIKLMDVFKNVRGTVERESNGKQIPWELTSLKEDFYFAGSGAASEPSNSGLVRTASAENEGRWVVVANATNYINSNRTLSDTGLEVESGMALQINVGGAGKINLGKNTYSGPTGTMDPDPGKPLPDCPTGAVIARIGEKYICVKSEYSQTVQSSGQLWLGINEGNVADNSGGYTVKIQIQKFVKD